MKRMISEVMIFEDSEENPCFGEGTTRIGLDDHAAGMFITISQSHADDFHKLGFNPSEIDPLIEGLRFMRDKINGSELAVSDNSALNTQLVIDAARETLAENLHLADGDVCTLKVLRDALSKLDSENV